MSKGSHMALAGMELTHLYQEKWHREGKRKGVLEVIEYP